MVESVCYIDVARAIQRQSKRQIELSAGGWSAVATIGDWLGEPATVVMMPLTSTFRIVLLPTQAIYMSPALSSAIPKGYASCALVAGPPSPAKPELPGVPATVVMMPLVLTLRISWFASSAM